MLFDKQGQFILSTPEKIAKDRERHNLIMQRNVLIKVHETIKEYNALNLTLRQYLLILEGQIKDIQDNLDTRF